MSLRMMNIQALSSQWYFHNVNMGERETNHSVYLVHLLFSSTPVLSTPLISLVYTFLPLELAVFICRWASSMILLFDMWIENVAYMVK